MFVVKHPHVFAVHNVDETSHFCYHLTFPPAEVWKNCSSFATTATLGRLGGLFEGREVGFTRGVPDVGNVFRNLSNHSIGRYLTYMEP